MNPGRRLELGGRELTLLRPPSYDSASSLAVYDVTGRCISAPTPSARSCRTWWRTLRRRTNATTCPESLCSPGRTPHGAWTALVGPVRFELVLAEINRLAPHRLRSAHGGTVEDRTDTLLDVLREVPTKPPWLPDEDLEVEAVLARVEAGKTAAGS